MEFLVFFLFFIRSPLLIFFFFQAEDGIRDKLVTGVQTCAHPISPAPFVSKNNRWEFNVDKANQILEAAGWKKGADGIRAKDGKKLKMVYQTSINAPRQKTQQ